MVDIFYPEDFFPGISKIKTNPMKKVVDLDFISIPSHYFVRDLIDKNDIKPNAKIIWCIRKFNLALETYKNAYDQFEQIFSNQINPAGYYLSALDWIEICLCAEYDFFQDERKLLNWFAKNDKESRNYRISRIRAIITHFEESTTSDFEKQRTYISDLGISTSKETVSYTEIFDTLHEMELKLETLILK